MSARKIAMWHKAGVIDAATRDRLLAYEAARARPLALWAAFGIGALAIALGLVAVIAANWEAIPGRLRLGVHFALLAGALFGLHWGGERLAQASPWALEALVFTAAALGLTFLGHLGQVYQSASPLWQPLAAWLVLFAPLLLLIGRSWPAAFAVVGGAIWCAWAYALAAAEAATLGALGTERQMWLGLVMALPLAFAPLAAALRARSARPQFWQRLEQLALSYAVAAASLATLSAGLGSLSKGALGEGWPGLVTAGALALMAGLATARARGGTSGAMTGAIIAGAGAVLPLAYAADGLKLAPALLFMGLWVGIAAAALAAQWRGVFQLSVGMIALRLIILSFELAGDLLASGLGLILAGCIILGVAWAALRVSQALAPARGDAA